MRYPVDISEWKILNEKNLHLCCAVRPLRWLAYVRLPCAVFSARVCVALVNKSQLMLLWHGCLAHCPLIGVTVKNASRIMRQFQYTANTLSFILRITRLRAGWIWISWRIKTDIYFFQTICFLNRVNMWIQYSKKKLYFSSS